MYRSLVGRLGGRSGSGGIGRIGGIGRRFAAVSALAVAVATGACSGSSAHASAPPVSASGAVSSTEGASSGATAPPTSTGSIGTSGTPPSANSPASTTPSPPGIQHVSVVAGGPDNNVYDTSLNTLQAGPVEITLTNRGTVEHQAMLIRLGDSMDFGQFTLQLLADPTRANVFRLVQGYGGPNAVFPNGTASSTQVLSPGNYAMACFLPGTGSPHAAQGMIRPFTVTGAPDGTASPLPPIAGEPEIQLTEFKFIAPAQLRAGQSVRVVNTGQQTHELGLYRLEGTASPEDLVAAFERADPKPPTSGGGGLGGLRPGAEARFVVPSTPGTYAMVCFFPDTSGSGKTHVHLGMLTQVMVI